jgi:hypothetical protein
MFGHYLDEVTRWSALKLGWLSVNTGIVRQITVQIGHTFVCNSIDSWREYGSFCLKFPMSMMRLPDIISLQNE